MAQEQVRELSQDARRVYQDVREGMLALRSQLGEGRTLRQVLEEYVSEFEIQLHRPVEVTWRLGDGDLALTPLQEVQVLRIVQEALANVRKHAEAGQAWVSFAARDGHLEVEVRDNGKGFNPLAVRRGEWPHLGLQTMQERAEGIGGAFVLESAPGRGTMVRVRIPHGVVVGASGGLP
jgi:two-component system nitrate/nitrite sensor histidine kinase NarX